MGLVGSGRIGSVVFGNPGCALKTFASAVVTVLCFLTFYVVLCYVLFIMFIV